MQSLVQRIITSLSLNTKTLEHDKQPNQILKDLVAYRIHAIISSNKNFVKAISRNLIIDDYLKDLTIIYLSNDRKSILVGIHEDEIIWLDNHYDNQDFGRLLFNIGVTKHIFEESISADDLANIILETKLQYLAEPRLIKNVSEIPQRYPPSAKLASMSNQISTPILQRLNDHDFILEFCFWTKQLGFVCKAKIIFRDPNLIDMDLKVLVGGVGEFIPRLL